MAAVGGSAAAGGLVIGVVANYWPSALDDGSLVAQILRNRTHKSHPPLCRRGNWTVNTCRARRSVGCDCWADPFPDCPCGHAAFHSAADWTRSRRVVVQFPTLR